MEYDDGTHDYSFSNVITENLYSQVDSEGHQFFLLEEISDHRIDRTYISVAGEVKIRRGGNKHSKKTTRGWELLTQMKEGFSKWVPLKYIK